MAFAFVQNVVQLNDSTALLRTLTATIPAGKSVTAPNLLVLSAEWTGAIANLLSVSDSKRNVWVVDVSGQQGGTGPGNAIAHCICSTPLLAGDKITITTEAGVAQHSLAVAEWSGGAGLVDVKAVTLQNASGVSPSTNPITTVSAGDLVVASYGFGIATPVFTPGAGWTALTRIASGSRSQEWEYQIQGAAGAITGTCTTTAAAVSAANIVSYTAGTAQNQVANLQVSTAAIFNNYGGRL